MNFMTDYRNKTIIVNATTSDYEDVIFMYGTPDSYVENKNDNSFVMTFFNSDGILIVIGGLN